MAIYAQNAEKPESTDDVHYTATINVYRVDKKRIPGTPMRSPAEEKDTVEVGKIVIRAATLESLVAKAGKHLVLIEEN